MNKNPFALNYFQELAEKHKRTVAPPVIASIIKQSNKDFFEVATDDTGLRLTASSELTAIGAFEQLKLAAQSGRIREKIGVFDAKFSSRLLWIKATKKFLISDVIGIGLPESLLTNPEYICKKILDLGFNGIILGDDELQPIDWISTKEINLQELCEAIAGHGLKIFLKPSLKTEDPTLTRDKLVNQTIDPFLRFLSSDIGIFYKYKERQSADREYTQYERVLRELKKVENACNGAPLCFQLCSHSSNFNSNQAYWIAELVLDASPKTKITFSAVKGAPWQDDKAFHPVWNECSKRDLGENLPLLPILNIGGRGRGDGLWPLCGLSVLNRFLGKMLQLDFQGAICMTPSLPAQGTFLEGALAAAGQSLWHGSFPQEHFHVWLSARHPRRNAEELGCLVQAVEELSILLASLKNYDASERDPQSIETKKALAEYLLSAFNRLNLLAKEDDEKLPPYSLEPYLAVFIRDGRRYVHHFLHQHRIPLPYQTNDQDIKAGFWTTRSGNSADKSKSAEIRQTPFQGEEGSLLYRLYQEVYPAEAFATDRIL